MADSEQGHGDGKVSDLETRAGQWQVSNMGNSLKLVSFPTMFSAPLRGSSRSQAFRFLLLYPGSRLLRAPLDAIPAHSVHLHSPFAALLSPHPTLLSSYNHIQSSVFT